jgi:hypothetical protein
MPEISRFYGIAIRMYSTDHTHPHFHAVCEGGMTIARQVLVQRPDVYHLSTVPGAHSLEVLDNGKIGEAYAPHRELGKLSQPITHRCVYFNADGVEGRFPGVCQTDLLHETLGACSPLPPITVLGDMIAGLNNSRDGQE